MTGFRRMNEEGRGAGGGKGRGNLAADVPRFAESRNDQPSLGIPDQFSGARKGGAEIGLQRTGQRRNAAASLAKSLMLAFSGRGLRRPVDLVPTIIEA